MRVTGLILFVLVISSCARKTDDKFSSLNSIDSTKVNGVDFLAMFPANDWKTFVGTNGKDQMAILLRRDTMNVFNYRIELLRKWKGLPLDYGELEFKRIESDSAYVFEGGNSDCVVVIRLYGAKRVGQDYMQIERDCENDSLDITVNEFKRLTYKG